MAESVADTSEVDPTIGYPLVRGPHGGVGSAFDRRSPLRAFLGLARLDRGEPAGRALHRAVCRAYGVLPSTHGSMAGAAEAVGIPRQIYVRLVQSTDPAHLFDLRDQRPGLCVVVDSVAAVVCDYRGLATRARAVAPIDLGERSSRSVVSKAVDRLPFLESGGMFGGSLDWSPRDAFACDERGPGFALHSAILASVDLPPDAYGASAQVARRLDMQVRAYDSLVHRGRVPGVLALAQRLGLALAWRYERRRTPEWSVGPLNRLVQPKVLALPAPW